MSASPSLPLLFPDSTTRGAHFLNATARMYEDRLRFTGTFDAAELLPVLLFSVGVPWVEPCVANVCCLWEMALRYKDNDLLMAIGDSCNENLNFTGRRLMKGSTITSLGGGGGVRPAGRRFGPARLPHQRFQRIETILVHLQQQPW